MSSTIINTMSSKDITSSSTINSIDSNKSNKIIDKNEENDKYIETPWSIIESYFKGHHLQRLVRHQIESYNNFVGSYNVSLSGTYYNTGYSSSISGIVLNAATANGPGGYIRFFVTQVGSTTPGAGLKITIFGQTSEIN